MVACAPVPTLGPVPTALLLAALALLSIRVSRALWDDYCSPAALVVAAWCGTLALYCARALPYPPLGTETRWVIAATIALLAGGSIAGALIAARQPAPPRPAPADDIGRVGWWISTYSILGMFGVAWYFWAIVTILGWDALGEPIRIRGALHSYEIPSRFLFLQFFCVIAPLLAFAVWLSGARVHRAVWIGPVLCAAATWLSTDRTQFFLLVLTAFCMYTFRHGRALRPRGFVLATGLAGLLLATNFLVVGAILGKTAASWYIVRAEPTPRPPTSMDGASARPVLVSLAVRQAVPPAAAGPAAPDGVVARAQALIARQLRRTLQFYAYATGSYAALDLYLREPHVLTGGRHVFYPLLRSLERLGLLATPLPSPFPPFRMVIPHPDGPARLEFNAYTFLYYPLEDFGVIGALAYVLAVGLGCGWCYGRARRDRRSATGLLIVGQISTALVLTVFVNKFNNTAWWYVLAATITPFAAARAYAALLGRGPVPRAS
jgi:hypothetical protein